MVLRTLLALFLGGCSFISIDLNTTCKQECKCTLPSGCTEDLFNDCKDATYRACIQNCTSCRNDYKKYK